jgi:uncharacterized membrane protein YhaH (DUF805 family)
MQQMTLAFRTVLSKYATFSGRASRPEFWWWVLAVFLLTALTQLIDAFLMAPMLGFDVGSETAGQPLSMLVSLILFLPGLAVAARRLHDIGRSGWWLFLYLIPIIGFLVLLWFYTRPSDGPNQWGPPNPLS